MSNQTTDTPTEAAAPEYDLSDALQALIAQTADPAGELFAIADFAQDFHDLSDEGGKWELMKAKKRDGMIRKQYTPTAGLRTLNVAEIVFERTPDSMRARADVRMIARYEIPAGSGERILRAILNEQAEKSMHKGRNAYKNLWRFI